MDFQKVFIYQPGISPSKVTAILALVPMVFLKMHISELIPDRLKKLEMDEESVFLTINPGELYIYYVYIYTYTHTYKNTFDTCKYIYI